MRSRVGLRVVFTISNNERCSQARSWIAAIIGPEKGSMAISSVRKPIVLVVPRRRLCAARLGR